MTFKLMAGAWMYGIKIMPKPAILYSVKGGKKTKKIKT